MTVVCANCKTVMGEKSGPDVITHTVCPECMKKLYPECTECGHIIVGAITSVSSAEGNKTLCDGCAAKLYPGFVTVLSAYDEDDTEEDDYEPEDADVCEHGVGFDEECEECEESERYEDGDRQNETALDREVEDLR